MLHYFLTCFRFEMDITCLLLTALWFTYVCNTAAGQHVDEQLSITLNDEITALIDSKIVELKADHVFKIKQLETKLEDALGRLSSAEKEIKTLTERLTATEKTTGNGIGIRMNGTVIN